MTLPSADLQRLLAEEPFVRALANSLIADEADDVVQQAYLRAIEQRPAAVREPRSWLARIVRNLAADQRRRRKRREARQRTGASAPHPLVPSSAELVEAEEHRRALVAAVDGLPEQLRAVVLLRYFEGLPPRHIARDLGVNVQVVWDRLHQALVALRARLDAQHGGERRAWLLPLVPFAASPRALPWQELSTPLPAGSAAMALGVIAMTTKTQIAATAAVLLTAAVAWLAWGADQDPGPRLAQEAAVNPAELVRSELPAEKAGGAANDVTKREAALAASALPTTGGLIVHVRHEHEPRVAAGLTVVLARSGGSFRVGLQRAVTDRDGRARFDQLEPGAVLVQVPPNARRIGAEVEAGKTAECELAMRGGMTLSGVVVDTAGVPITGALVEAADEGTDSADASPVAVTGADGAFTVRDCGVCSLVGARARGFAASKLYPCRGQPGGAESVRIELRAPGGSVEGVVRGPDGAPIADAVVRVGEGRTDAIKAPAQGAPPLPAQVVTDANGRFVAIGVPAGAQPIQGMAEGFAPWRGSCEVSPSATTAVQIELSPGVTCRGIVNDEQGLPIAAAAVNVGKAGDFVRFRTRSGTDGTFVLRGLPPGDVDIEAEKEKVGKASVHVRGGTRAVVTCELMLTQGIVLRGRVLDEAGAPLRPARVLCTAEGEGPHWGWGASPDPDGRFAVANCPPGRKLTVDVSATGRVSWQRRNVDPRAGELEVLLPKDTAPRARISGRLLLPDGSGAIGVEVAVWRGPNQVEYVQIEDVSGSFVLAVAADRYSVRIAAKGYPVIRRDERQLAAGEAWDLGTLQLTRGGTLLVREPAAKLTYSVYDLEDRWVCGLYAPVPPLRSEALAPRDYRLFVSGEGVSPQVLPFTIRAGEETTLDVRTSPGVRHRIEFVVASGTEPPRSVVFTIRRDGSNVLIGFTDTRLGSLAAETWLAPGDYELVTRDREPVTTFPFTVGSAAGQPLRIELR